MLQTIALILMHVLMPVLAVGVFLATAHHRKWLRLLALLGVWLGLGSLDFAAFAVHDLRRGGAFAAYLVAIGLCVAAAVGAAKLMQIMHLSTRWQTAVGVAAGILALLPSPYVVVASYCVFTGVCL